MGLIAHPQGYPLLATLADGVTALVIGWTAEDAPVVLGASNLPIVPSATPRGYQLADGAAVGTPPARKPQTTGDRRGLRP